MTETPTVLLGGPREYLFDARTGYYLVDFPAGFAWGWAELDPAAHTIIRSEDPKFHNRDALRCRRQRLATTIGSPLPGTNIWADGVLGPVPAEEQIGRSAYISLRTGRKYEDEETMWADCRDGDVLALSHRPAQQGHADYVLRIISARDRKLDYRPVSSMREVELEVAKCRSSR